MTYNVHPHKLITLILSYRDKRTRQFAEGIREPRFESFGRQAERRLEILAAATALFELAAMRSNGLERLSGSRSGQYSIRINAQWRLCFEWPESQRGPSNVEIVDYHH